MTVKLIVAHDERRGIGRGGDMPWHVPGELRWTAEVTRTAPPGRRNALILGSATYFSIPAKRRPLVGRLNIVISTRQLELEPGALLAASFDEALRLAAGIPEMADVFIFGGARIYRQALDALVADELLISEVTGDYQCDTFFPTLPAAYTLQSSTTVAYGTSEVRHDHYTRT